MRPRHIQRLTSWPWDAVGGARHALTRLADAKCRVDPNELHLSTRRTAGY